MKKFIEDMGGRKQIAWYLLFLAITILFAFGYDIMEYAKAMGPYMGLLTVGNLVEHKLKQK